MSTAWQGAQQAEQKTNNEVEPNHVKMELTSRPGGRVVDEQSSAPRKVGAPQGRVLANG